MNILILGSGGREHTFAWKLSQSPKCKKLYVAPGNAGTAALAQNVNLSPNDFPAIASFIKENAIDMLVVGPEAPLVNGIADYFENKEEFESLCVIGPKKAGAQLEGSKDFSKAFMKRHNIPTAQSKTFTKDTIKEGIAYLEKHEFPVVLKADGLAAGKGVLICENRTEAILSLKEMLLDAKFGEASSKVVIEQFLKGIELSVFVLTDGESYLILPEAKDYKRIGEGDTGLNTGGMGAISPVHFAHNGFLKKVEQQVIKPSIAGLKKDGLDYSGFLFIGLMNVNSEPYVIEYNVRMGDPETEVVLPRIKNDLVPIFQAVASKSLSTVRLQTEERTATTVIMVAGGYPETYEKGKAISGLEEVEEGIVFHSGTKEKHNTVLTNGGRVLALTALGNNKNDALRKSYAMANQINWDGKYFRKDIGFDL